MLRIRNCKTSTISKLAASPSGGIHANSFEILYITHGTAKFQWSGHNCVTEAPAIFMILPSTPHTLESTGAEINCLFIELDEVDKHLFTTSAVDSWNSKQSHKMISAKTLITATIEQSLDLIHHFHLTGMVKQYEEIEQVCLLEVQKIFKLITHILLSTSMESPHRPKRKVNSYEAVDILLNYMEWKYREEITLGMLSAAVHLNPSYLIRIFKEQTQMTPMEYLQALRMKAAVSYLTQSNLPLQKIVEETGFNSIHYFCRLFKKKYGDSPVHWRNQLVGLYETHSI